MNLDFATEWLKIQQEQKKKELVWYREQLMGSALEWVALETVANHLT